MGAKTAAAPTTEKPRLLINRDFTLLWGGRAISNLGELIAALVPLALTPGIPVVTQLGVIYAVVVLSTTCARFFISVVLVVLGFGALNALNIFFVTGNLHAPARLYSFTTTAVGVGAVVGVALAGLLTPRLGVARTFWASMVALGLIVLVYARLTSFAPAVVLLFLLGIPNAAIDVAIGPIVLHVTPREYLGRISAVLSPSVSLATMLSLALAGFLDSTLLHGFHATLFGVSWGPVNTIFTLTGLLTVAGGFYALLNLRGVTLAGDHGYVAAGVPATEEAPDAPA